MPPWRAIKEWIPDDEPPVLWDQRPGTAWKAPEIPLGDGLILVLEST